MMPKRVPICAHSVSSKITPYITMLIITLVKTKKLTLIHYY